MVDQAIWSKKMSNGMRRTPVSAEQVCIKKSTLKVLQYFNKWCDTILKTFTENADVYRQICNALFMCLLRPELITVRSVQRC